MTQLLILVIGALSIAFVAWYFFGKKEEITETFASSINIQVDSGYSPSTIVLKKDRSVTLKILRTDPTDCLEEIIIPEWKIKKTLPLNKKVVIQLHPQKSGEFPFHCGMNMFHGKIIVKS